MQKDLLSVEQFSPKEIREIFSLAREIKSSPSNFKDALKDKALLLLFEKPSNRTRISFEVGVWQLGGHCIYSGPGEIRLGIREAVKDVGSTLSRYVDAIILRTFSHKKLEELAKNSSIPVINGLTDLLHPCQALCDLFTIEEKIAPLKGKVFSYIGDGNNVCNSLIHACAKLDVNMKIACPKKHQPDQEILKKAYSISAGKSAIEVFNDPRQAVKGADVIYTDVWVSMGQEKQALKRKKIFRNFQVNAKLVQAAGKKPLIMHCLPAHRNEEITDEVIDSPDSIVFDQAENRLHVQKAILVYFLKR